MKKIQLFLFCQTLLFAQVQEVLNPREPTGQSKNPERFRLDTSFGLQYNIPQNPVNLTALSKLTRRSDEVDLFFLPKERFVKPHHIDFTLEGESQTFFSYLRMGLALRYQLVHFFNEKVFNQKETFYWPSAPSVALTQLPVEGRENSSIRTQKFWFFLKTLFAIPPNLKFLQTEWQNAIGIYFGIGLSYWEIENHLDFKSPYIQAGGHSGVYSVQAKSHAQEENPFLWGTGLYYQGKFILPELLPIFLRLGFEYQARQKINLKQAYFVLYQNDSPTYTHIKENLPLSKISQTHFFVSVGFQKAFGAVH